VQSSSSWTKLLRLGWSREEKSWGFGVEKRREGADRKEKEKKRRRKRRREEEEEEEEERGRKERRGEEGELDLIQKMRRGRRGTGRTKGEEENELGVKRKNKGAVTKNGSLQFKLLQKKSKR
jgi:hypothetical protein